MKRGGVRKKTPITMNFNLLVPNNHCSNISTFNTDEAKLTFKLKKAVISLVSKTNLRLQNIKIGAKYC